jgi:putative copper resistance protein D
VSDVLAALIVCRCIHFAAVMALFGASAYLWALAPAELARALTPSVRRIVAAAIVVAALSAVAWLGLEAASMGEGWADALDPSVLASVLTDTAFGAIWRWRLPLLAFFVIALATGRHDRWALVASASALLLASLGLAGHAIMRAGALGALHRANDALHLLLAGAWIGGLPPFILCVDRFGDPTMKPQALLAARRFSAWGHLVVALILLTGAANVALTLRIAPIPLASPYQTLLAVKIALVAVMIIVALFNRYVIVPRLADDAGRASAALKVNAIAEAAMGLIVVALVSAFGLMAPA